MKSAYVGKLLELVGEGRVSWHRHICRKAVDVVVVGYVDGETFVASKIEPADG